MEKRLRIELILTEGDDGARSYFVRRIGAPLMRSAQYVKGDETLAKDLGFNLAKMLDDARHSD